jgi:hypothetical protein
MTDQDADDLLQAFRDNPEFYAAGGTEEKLTALRVKIKPMTLEAFQADFMAMAAKSGWHRDGDKWQRLA